MKTIILGLTLILTSTAFAEGRGIVCERAKGVQGCEKYLIHLQKQHPNSDMTKLSLGQLGRNGVCASEGWLDSKQTESLGPLLSYLSRKADKLPRKIKLEGESSSSGGFGLSTKTLLRVQLDLATGSGKLEYRSGKGAFNPLTDNYMFVSSNDPARNEVLENCKEIDL